MENEIAVIIPTYNSEKTIKRAVDSVNKQILDNYTLKIIVVDDCSQDKTREVVEGMDNVQFFKNYQSTGGPNEGRNAGIEIARDAKYIAFLDHDDEWLPGKLLTQVNVMDKTGINTSFTGYRIISRDRTVDFVYGVGNIVKYSINTLFKIFLLRDMNSHVLPYMSSLVVRNENVPLFDDPVYDYEWSLRLLKNKSVIYIDRVLMNRYESGENLSNDEKYISGGMKHIDKTLRKYLQYKEARLGKKCFHFNDHINKIRAGNKKEAYKALWKTFF